MLPGTIWVFAAALGRLNENAHRFDGIVMNGIGRFQASRPVMLQARRRAVWIFVHGALDPWFNKKYPLEHLKKWIYW